MGYIKENFDKLIDNNGHQVLLKHTDKNRSCPKKDCSSRCTHCFGYDFHYDVHRIKVRRTEASYLDSEGLDSTEVFSFASKSYDYFFKSEYPVNTKDFIIEYFNNNIRLFLVINYTRNFGMDGVAFQTVRANEVNIDLEIVKDDLRDLIEGR